jgi:ABC-type antimicrobial peptide transport system permease subunit
VIAYSVTQRKREIGVRIALGARPRNVIALVLKQGLPPTAVGIAAGVVGGIVLSRFLEAQLFEVTPNDAITAVTVTTTVALVALLASYVPARRASRLDPTEAVRAQ